MSAHMKNHSNPTKFTKIVKKIIKIVKKNCKHQKSL